MSKKQLPPEVPEERPASPADAGSSPPPRFAVPVPAPVGNVPRVIKPIERAPTGTGLTRYKVRCDNYAPRPIAYILAANPAQAEEEYLRFSRLGPEIEALKAKRERDKKAGFTVGEIDSPSLVITALPD